MENGLSSRMVFQDEAIHFSRTGGDHTAPRKPTAAAGFVMDGDKMFSGDRRDDRFVRSQYGSQNPSWNVDLDGGSPSGDGSDGEDEEEDDDDDDDDVEDDDLDDGDGAVDGFEGNKIKNSNNSNGGVQSCSGKVHGLSRGMMKDGSLSEQQQQNDRVGSYENAITVVEPELYCAQILHGGDGSASVQKEIGGENGYGFGGRKEIGLAVDPRESLRKHLLDPITGALMDDAMILSCGHSFGSGGMKQVFRMKACCKCSQPISKDLVRPNLALRSAVQAFCREEESQSSKASKRRRDRFEQINVSISCTSMILVVIYFLSVYIFIKPFSSIMQDKCSYNDPYSMDTRGKGVQFPFVVSDRVIIKGNKRTPQRFVGRVAVVTTQCLNGWYVVKTLDNAESVKLQYRSLAKVSDDSPSNMIQNKSITPNWL